MGSLGVKEVVYMGKILKQKLAEDGILAEVLLSRDETRDLGGIMDNVTVFTDDRATVQTRISLRGRHEATKYFLIPKQLRKDLNVRGSVSCQRIRRGTNDVFVYIVRRDGERKSFIAES